MTLFIIAPYKYYYSLNYLQVLSTSFGVFRYIHMI